MEKHLSDELYPIVDFTGQKQIDIVDDYKKFPVYQHENGIKYVLMDKQNICQFSEVAFSKLAKQLKIRAADNDFAVCDNENAGVASKFFLNKNEKISDFNFENESCKHFAREHYYVFQNADISKLHALCRTNMIPLHPDFSKNLVESYLFSVLSSNFDHLVDRCLGTYYIMNLRLTNNGVNNNLAPYHDMEHTFLKKSCDYTERVYQEILNGYQSNIPNLRTKYKRIHDRFLDNLDCVDAAKLSDFSKPHLIKRIANNDAQLTEHLSDKFEKKLTQQIKFMKNYHSCHQEP